MSRASVESEPRAPAGAPRGRPYAQLASEYYDEKLHPTCHAFREGSRLALGGWRNEIDRPRLCEVGSGRSLVLDELYRHWETLVVVDASREMLLHSRPVPARTHLVVGEAAELPLPAASVDCVVSSLGDPYNTPAFWQGTRRVLTEGGVVVYTTPAYTWARDFRGAKLEAEFRLADGRTLLTPSLVYSQGDQSEMMEHAGFELLAVREITLDEVKAAGRLEVSPVKLMPRTNPTGAVVTGYLARAK